MTAQSHEGYLELLRDLVLVIAGDVDCAVFLFGAESGTAGSDSAINIGFSGLSEASFLDIKNALLAELEDSIMPLPIELVHLDTTDEEFRRSALAGAFIWKQGKEINR